MQVNLKDLPPLDELVRWSDWYQAIGHHIIASKAGAKNLILVKHRNSLLEKGLLFPLATGFFIRNGSREFEQALVSLLISKRKSKHHKIKEAL